MGEEILTVDKMDGIVTLTLNRPDKLNALSIGLRSRIAEVFAELENDAEASVVILTGAGRAFCAGLDLSELGLGDGVIGESGAVVDDPSLAMARCTRPIIGAINGPAITGGLELALACDVLLASRDAKFADTHGHVGLSPGWGLSQKLPRIIGLARAKEMSLTGNFIDAGTAERWGLVNRVLAPDELLPACRALAADMASVVPGFLPHYKNLLDSGYGMTLGDGLAYEAAASRSYNRSVTAADIEARRGSVHRRGRRQQ